MIIVSAGFYRGFLFVAVGRCGFIRTYMAETVIMAKKLFVGAVGMALYFIKWKKIRREHMHKISEDFIRLYKRLEESYSDCRLRIDALRDISEGLEDILTREIDAFEPLRCEIMGGLGRISAEFTPQQRKVHQDWVKESAHWTNIQEAPFCLRIIHKPAGYAGDHELMRMIYRNSFEGESNWGRFIHKQAVGTAACQAVRNRREFLRGQILEAIQNGGDVLSVAAGPAKEMLDILQEDKGVETCSFLALDHDINSLRLANFQDNKRFSYGLANAFHMMKSDYSVAFPRRWMLNKCDPRRDFKGFRKLFSPFKYQFRTLDAEAFDLVYSAGLYDYIQTFPEKSRGATALTRNLFHLVKPGGSLIIGNFSPKNPPDLRFPMEILYDWILLYRDQNEMYRLAEEIPDSEIARITLLEEPLGINCFLKIVKRL